MTTDVWYALRSGATAYKTAGVRGRLTGAVGIARSAGVTWPRIAKAAGLSESTIRKVIA